MSFISFILFIAIQVCFFRLVPSKKVLIGIVVVFMVSGLLTTGAIFYVLKFDAFRLVFMMWVLYSLMTFLYIVGVFGVIESSIRLRLLTFVAASPEGTSMKKIYRSYNYRIIVKKRLDRLSGSGELVFSEGKYRVGRKFSLFLLPAYLALLLKKLYGVG